jgi:hypothetical protein
MLSDRPKRPRQPSDIAGRFRELQQLRKLVHEAELEFSRSRIPRSDFKSKVESGLVLHSRGDHQFAELLHLAALEVSRLVLKRFQFSVEIPRLTHDVLQHC